MNRNFGIFYISRIGEVNIFCENLFSRMANYQNLKIHFCMFMFYSSKKWISRESNFVNDKTNDIEAFREKRPKICEIAKYNFRKIYSFKVSSCNK